MLQLKFCMTGLFSGEKIVQPDTNIFLFWGVNFEPKDQAQTADFNHRRNQPSRYTTAANSVQKEEKITVPERRGEKTKQQAPSPLQCDENR